MRSPVAVTLVITGALLIMAPPISDYLYQLNLVNLRGRPGVANVNLAGQITRLSRFACWLTGTIMIGIAILASAKPEAPYTDSDLEEEEELDSKTN